MDKQEFISKIGKGETVTINGFDFWSRKGKYYWAKSNSRNPDFDEVLFLESADQLWLMSQRREGELWNYL